MSALPLVPLSPCTIIRASGPDALRFLNGQLTNDVALATADTTLPAAALNAKGGLEGVCWLHKIGEDYLLDAPLSLRQDLLARLDRYLIADEVTLTDESDDWSLSHLLTESSPDGFSPAMRAPSSRFGVPGVDLFSRGPLPEIPDALPLSPAQVTALRVKHGIPAWGHELNQGMLPPEAGLQASAISYEKGCYLGQEVISRMKWSGKTNRHLVRLEVPHGTQAPCPFLHDGQEAGEITTVSPCPESECALALGFRRRKFEDRTEFSLEATAQNRVRVVARLA